jgi:hypothetical protein
MNHRFTSGRSGMHPERNLPDTPVIHVDAGYLMTAVGHSEPTQKTSEGLLCPAIPDIPAL